MDRIFKRRDVTIDRRLKLYTEYKFWGLDTLKKQKIPRVFSQEDFCASQEKLRTLNHLRDAKLGDQDF